MAVTVRAPISLDVMDQHTLALTVSYDGKLFSGFAQQPGRLTVQGSLHEALELLYKRPVEIACAGRTDAGVHARGQVISFTLSGEERAARPLQTLKRSLNALIDEHAAILSIEEKPLRFSARFDAKSREYRYYLHTNAVRAVLIEDQVWHIGKELNVDAMRAGAAYLIGEHDFKSFCLAVSAVDKSTQRKVLEIDIFEEELIGEKVLVIRVVGNAFLHSMVRTIVGTLVMVGREKREPAWVAKVLEAKDRSVAGENAPAKGLFFWKVNY